MWQAAQILLAQLHIPAAFISQQVLGELGPKGRKAGFDLLHAGVICPFQRRTAAHKSTMGQHQNTRLFLAQIQRIALVPHGFDTGIKRLVGGDGGKMCRQLGRKRPLQRLALGVTVGPGHAVKHRQNLLQLAAGGFQRLDHIGKSRCLLRGRNRVDLRLMGSQRLLQCGGKIAVLDLVERGNFKWRVPGGQQRIGHGKSPL